MRDNIADRERARHFEHRTMTGPWPTDEPRLLVQPFPQPGRLLRLAYRELDLATTSENDHPPLLGEVGLLARPWVPATCRNPDLRAELWTWLDAIVIWVNTQFTWDAAATIPPCWPQHPHLIHDIAVLADQRRAAEDAFTSDALEEWNRNTLPYFQDRVKSRTRSHCDDDHQDWPARSRHTRHLRADAVQDRATALADDVRSVGLQRSLPTNRAL